MEIKYTFVNGEETSMVKSTALQVESPKKQSRSYLVRCLESQSLMNKYLKTK